MRRLLIAAIVALAPGLALAQEPSNSIYLPTGISPSLGLKAGWNRVTPLFCYGYTIGNDIYVKMVMTDDHTYLQTRNSTAANALMLMCAANKSGHVYSPDGLNWQGLYVSALPG